MFCRQCGAKLTDGSKYCHNCGAAAQSIPPLQSNPDKKVKVAKKDNLNTSKKDINWEDEEDFKSKKEMLGSCQYPLAVAYPSQKDSTLIVLQSSGASGNSLINCYVTTKTGKIINKAQTTFCRDDVVGSKNTREKHYSFVSVTLMLIGWIMVIGAFASGIVYTIGIGIIALIASALLRNTTYVLEIYLKDGRTIRIPSLPDVTKHDPLLAQMIYYITGQSTSLNYEDFNNVDRNYLTFLDQYPEFENSLYRPDVEAFIKLSH